MAIDQWPSTCFARRSYRFNAEHLVIVLEGLSQKPGQPQKSITVDHPELDESMHSSAFFYIHAYILLLLFALYTDLYLSKLR